jgi:hypothetical protein
LASHDDDGGFSSIDSGLPRRAARLPMFIGLLAARLACRLVGPRPFFSLFFLLLLFILDLFTRNCALAGSPRA